MTITLAFAESGGRWWVEGVEGGEGEVGGSGFHLGVGECVTIYE